MSITNKKIRRISLRCFKSLSLLPILLSLFIDAVHLTLLSSQWVSAAVLLFAVHGLVAWILLWDTEKSKRQQDLKRVTSLFFHSARTKKHLFRAEQWYRHSSWLGWNSEEEQSWQYSPLCTGYAIIKYWAVLQFEGSRTCKWCKPRFHWFNDSFGYHLIPFSGKKLGNSSEVSYAETSVYQVTCCVKLAQHCHCK